MSDRAEMNNDASHSGQVASTPSVSPLPQSAAPPSSSVSPSSSPSSEFVSISRAQLQFFIHAAPQLHARVRALEEENRGLREENAKLQEEVEILDGVGVFLRDLSRTDMTYKQFVESRQKMIAEAEAKKTNGTNGGSVVTATTAQKSLPPIKHIGRDVKATGGSNISADSSSSSSVTQSIPLPTPSSSQLPNADSTPGPSIPRRTRVKYSQKRPPPPCAGAGAIYSFTPATPRRQCDTVENADGGECQHGDGACLSNPPLRHVRPYFFTYSTFTKRRWLGRTILDVLNTDFKPPTDIYTMGEEDEGEDEEDEEDQGELEADQSSTNTYGKQQPSDISAAPTSTASSNDTDPSSYYRSAIDRGFILVNDAPCTPDYIMKQGDRLTHKIHRHEPPVLDARPSSNTATAAIPIIFENDDLLIVDKPPGICVHESGKYRHQSLMGILYNQRLNSQSSQQQQQQGSDQMSSSTSSSLHPVHRLDRVTSGLLMLAKNTKTAATLGNIIQCKEHEQDQRNDKKKQDASNKNQSQPSVEKIYLARVQGRFPSPADGDTLAHDHVRGLSISNRDGDGDESHLILDAPILTISHRKGLHAVDFSRGKTARTCFRRLSYDEASDTSVVEARPRTGRTHQIRLHLEYLGHPIINDPIYGGQLYEGNSYAPPMQHPDPMARLPAADQVDQQHEDEREGVFVPGCHACEKQMYYAQPDKIKTDPSTSTPKSSIRYCTGIFLHALSYSATHSTSLNSSVASTSSSSPTPPTPASLLPFSFSTPIPEWAKPNFDVNAFLGRPVRSSRRARDVWALEEMKKQKKSNAEPPGVEVDSTSITRTISSDNISASSPTPSPLPPSFHIRFSRHSDLPAITAIYSHHTLHATGSFEEHAPSQEEMERRWRGSTIERGMPFLVATINDTIQTNDASPTLPRTQDNAVKVDADEAKKEKEMIVGFAYADLFRTRTAYRYTLEDSVYVHPSYTSRFGVGSALLSRLLAIVSSLGYKQMLAVIGDSANKGSIRLHAKHDFEHVGTMRDVGVKFGAWRDVVIMQKRIGHSADGEENNIPTEPPRRCEEQVVEALKEA